jgi:hypothetical protein
MKQQVLIRTILGVMVLAAALSISACSSCLPGNVEGTYSDVSGAFKVELKDGGKATLTTLNSPTPCTYVKDGKKLALTCENRVLSFTIQDDGSLMPPEEAGIGPLKKAK